MGKAEICRKFDEIVTFSEVEKFLDTPVKRYSSGMYIRLAFAVAAHLEPEILIVDEVLAVGDAQFQKKCLGKLEEVGREGRTVLFVSHNMESIQHLCRNALFLNSGRLDFIGTSQEAVSKYLFSEVSSSLDHCWANVEDAPGDGSVFLRRVAVVPMFEGEAQVITVSTPLRFEFEFWNFEDNAYLHLSIHVKNQRGVEVFNALPVMEENWHGKPFPKGLYRSTFDLLGDFFNDGTYFVDVHIVRDIKNLIFRYDEAISFTVFDNMETRGNVTGKWYGIVRPKLKWTTELLQENI